MSIDRIKTIRHYLKCLHDTDVPGLVATFEPDGIVKSPFLGSMVASEFFPRLAGASSQSVITPIDLFESVEPGGGIERVAAYFRYDWTLKDGKVVTFTCVDVFEFRPGSDRIASMTIVYDTHPLREEVGDKYA
ncbi:nuclear transport factor 2 family protein [Variovorax sp. J22R133]|uniref:nuclear transport factor 2 family protein n=1 Tax=Variovorax brevis TaxID=3053503 RepID=UPI0025788BF8|nr:nuclear transport factor 2 family protein [Variovorax sp. J22R133]MDM0115047.1 nuclear transport factor 2 family protein [Variovorax sp. J22R133]